MTRYIYGVDLVAAEEAKARKLELDGQDRVYLEQYEARVDAITTSDHVWYNEEPSTTGSLSSSTCRLYGITTSAI